LHDALCQFLRDGLPLSRREVDRCFLALLAESGFRALALLRRLFRVPEISRRTNLFHLSRHDIKFIGKA